VLNLPAQGLKSVTLLPLGYRDESGFQSDQINLSFRLIAFLLPLCLIGLKYRSLMVWCK